MQLPAPPSLKTTIIQLNKDIDPDDNNYEILTNEYSNVESFPPVSSAIREEQPRKKRRRSSSFVDDEELARRRNETKQLHSVIEKRRRIKINREFEALKYIIPACRNTEAAGKRGAGSMSNNGSKIDGMYKLTILKSSVEYIMYLHHIIQKQHEQLSRVLDSYNYDIGFSRVPLDVNQYRNIDKEFDFTQLANSAPKPTKCEPIHEEEERRLLQPPHMTQHQFQCNPARAQSDSVAEMRSRQLPSPDVTPDIAPILSLLSKYSGDAQTQQLLQQQKQLAEVRLQELLDLLSKAFLFLTAHHKTGLVSTSTSPFTIPIKSQMKKNTFHLPDPALSADSSGASTPAQHHPKKMFFKAKIPSTNMVASVGSDDGDADEDRLEDASKTLLTLRKPSIEKLLN